MPTINEKFSPPNGTDSLLVSGTLQLCGVTIMIALLLTAYELYRSRPAPRGLLILPDLGVKGLPHPVRGNPLLTDFQP